MKKNVPVSNSERDYSADIRIISTTDKKGIIRYMNDDFCDVAGFSREELTGVNHNVVRHPDMPEAAFANLWDTLKARKSWLGVVKNRCKNGDYYWVSAYVSPLYENGEIIGYQSVRSRPDRRLVERAQALYRRLAAGKGLHGVWQRLRMRSKFFAGTFAIQLATLAAVSFLFPISLAWLAGILLAGGALSYGLATLLTQGLRTAAESSREIVDNPVTSMVYGGGLDEVAQLSAALQMLKAKLQTFGGRVEDVVDKLEVTASNSIAAATQTSSVADRQQSEVHQVASAINEMTATIQEVARNTSAAADSAQQAQERATSGNKVVTEVAALIRTLADEVRQAAGAIQVLDQQSSNIGSVLGVIKNIAEQTNLLALNAAIEAARAGEQGRGFAVVADEVRGLATRTQESTVEIEQIIEQLQSGARTSVEMMARGQSVAEKAVAEVVRSAEALQLISDDVDNISNMNIQIASAVEEQGAVAEEINGNVSAINQASEETAQVAQDNVGGSRVLLDVVTELKGMVRQLGA